MPKWYKYHLFIGRNILWILVIGRNILGMIIIGRNIWWIPIHTNIKRQSESLQSSNAVTMEMAAVLIKMYFMTIITCTIKFMNTNTI